MSLSVDSHSSRISFPTREIELLVKQEGRPIEEISFDIFASRHDVPFRNTKNAGDTKNEELPIHPVIFLILHDIFQKARREYLPALRKRYERTSDDATRYQMDLLSICAQVKECDSSGRMCFKPELQSLQITENGKLCLGLLLPDYEKIVGFFLVPKGKVYHEGLGSPVVHSPVKTEIEIMLDRWLEKNKMNY